MKLRPNPLLEVAAKKRFNFNESTIEELHNLINRINTHPLKNLVAVIYYNLKSGGYLRKLPVELNKGLKEAYFGALVKDMQQRGWLQKFIKKELPSDVAIILLKGSANWGTIYSPEAPRTGVDIDILVRDRDFGRIIEIIEADAERIVLDERRKFSNRISYEYSYRIKSQPVSVEVHRRISYPFVGNVDYTNLFEKSVVHPHYRDSRVRILKPVDRIMHTLIHSLKHVDIGAHEIVDTYLIIKKYRLSVQSILDTALDFGIKEYATMFLLKLAELINDRSLLKSHKLTNNFYIRGNIFNILHVEDRRISFRIRQLLSLMMMDSSIDFLRFIKFYMGLRVKDFLYYNFPSLASIYERE